MISLVGQNVQMVGWLIGWFRAWVSHAFCWDSSSMYTIVVGLIFFAVSVDQERTTSSPPGAIYRCPNLERFVFHKTLRMNRKESDTQHHFVVEKTSKKPKAA